MRFYYSTEERFFLLLLEVKNHEGAHLSILIRYTL